MRPQLRRRFQLDMAYRCASIRAQPPRILLRIRVLPRPKNALAGVRFHVALHDIADTHTKPRDRHNECWMAEQGATRPGVEPTDDWSAGADRCPRLSDSMGLLDQLAYGTRRILRGGGSTRWTLVGATRLESWRIVTASPRCRVLIKIFGYRIPRPNHWGTLRTGVRSPILFARSKKTWPCGCISAKI